MRSQRLLVAAMAALMVLSALAPLGTVAADTNGDDDELDIDVSQEEEIVVTVESNETGEIVPDANVSVEVVDGNESYPGADNWTADDDGEVVLPHPEENVTVSIEVSHEDYNDGEKETTLKPPEDDPELDLDVTQDDETVTVKVTDDGEAVEKATVDAEIEDVESDWNVSNETDADGEVAFAAPTEDEVADKNDENEVNVTFTATYEGETVEDNEWIEVTEIDDEDEKGEEIDLNLSVSQDNETVTVEVTDNESAVENATVAAWIEDNESAWNDSEDTNVDGEVTFSAPTTDDISEETVDVVFNATYENSSAETIEEIDVIEVEDGDEPKNFGQLLQEFKEDELTDDEPRGLQIASFVVEHNPGNPPHAGPPAHAGPPEHAGGPNDDKEQGPPEHAGGPSDDKEQGPPEHAGGSNDAGNEAAEADDSDDEEGSDE